MTAHNFSHQARPDGQLHLSDSPPDLPRDLSMAPPPGNVIRVILLGDPGSIRQNMHLLHNLRYAEISQWSPLIEIPEQRLVITPEQGDQMSILVRRL